MVKRCLESQMKADFGPIPPQEYQKIAIKEILSSEPSILLFKHWWWLTGKSLPERHNSQTNDQYTRKHWFKLKKAAQNWVYKDIAERVEKTKDAISKLE